MIPTRLAAALADGFRADEIPVLALSELVSGPMTAIYLSMVVFVVLAAGCLFGEEFGIQRIKFGHALMGGLIVICVAVILLT